MHLSEIIAHVRRRVSNASDEDIRAAIDMVQNQYIQPVARVLGTATHTTTAEHEVVPLSEIASDIFEVDAVRQIASDGQKYPVQILLPEMFHHSGVRIVGGNVHVQAINPGTVLEFQYAKTLKRLGAEATETLVPEIAARWYALYWLGAAFLLGHVPSAQLFLDRLEQFATERNDVDRTPGILVRFRW